MHADRPGGPWGELAFGFVVRRRESAKIFSPKPGLGGSAGANPGRRSAEMSWMWALLVNSGSMPDVGG